jgi:peptidase S41-like protein
MKTILEIICLLAVAVAPMACGSVQTLQATTANSSPTLGSGEQAPRADYGQETGLAIYQDLLKATRKYHVFAKQTEQNLGIKWEDQLARLEKEFAGIKSRADLLRALNHFANSLHNPHCYYNSPDRPSYLTPGFEISVEWIDNKPSFYVAKITDQDLEKRIQPGDRLVSYQSVAAEDFLSTFNTESNGNHWRSIARDIAGFFSQQSAHRHGPLTQAEWGFQRPGSDQVVTIQAKWKAQKGPGYRGEFGLDYDSDSCAGLPKRNYGAGYAIEHKGANYCIYTTSQGPAKSYPIVRQFSFSYSGRNSFNTLKADHYNLKKVLGSLAGAKAVILDLRDNRGGNNPNWFLDWWAPASYKSYMVYTRLHQDFDSQDKLRQAHITGWGPPHFKIYLEALAKKSAEAQFMEPRPFFCPTPDCKGFDNLYRPKNQVTKLPVAMLVGPRCVSSCDSVVHTFREYDFGPVVGQAGSAGFTIARLQHKVRHPQSGEQLGFVALAFSYETSGKTGQKLEAVVVDPHRVVEPTFANRDRYDEILVKTAIEAFGNFKTPK